MKNSFLSHFQKTLLVYVFSLVSSWVYSQAPTISSFSPISGAVGSSVTISGTGFNTTAANNVVYFDGVKAAVTASTSTSLTVTVPSGTSGFSVLNYVNLSDKLSCASKLRFSTTFGNGGFSGDFSGGVAWGSNLSFSAPSNSYSSWGYGIKTPNLFADFNNDGKPDYAHIGSSSTSISPNTSSIGQISFGTQISLNSGGNGLQVGDIDNDGLIDLVIFNSSTAFVYRNNSSVAGTISFQSPISVSIATSVNRLLLKDMNNDGLIDIIGSNGTTLTYFLNTTTGSNIAFNSVSPVSITAPANISDFGIVDFDNNNQLDIIALHSSGYSISLNSAAFSSLVSSSNSADMMQVGDVNNDGFIDFAINYDPYSFKFFKNSGSNTFSEVVVNMTSSIGLARAIQLAEMSGNNLPDVIGCEFNSSRTYQIGNNTSTSSAISFPNCTKMYWGGSNFNTNVAVNDVDGDGRSDLTAFMSGNYIINRNIIGIPTISSFTPTSGGVGASVTISGTYFVGATDVKFNGVSATSITVNSASSITAIAPVGTTGTIQVITPGGTATSSSNFTFNPSITKSSNFTSFTTCSGTPSNAQSFTVSGNNLTASVSIGALTGYEYSTDGTTYSSSLNLTPTSGSIPSTTVYVRLTSSSTGSPSGNISLTSTNATTQTIAVSGTVTATSTPTATTSYTVCLGDSAPTISATPAASHTLRWYTVPTGGTASTSAPVPDVSAAGITSYYVSQFNSSTNCESARVAITVTVYALPSAPTATTTINYCQGATATALAATATSGYSLQWYTASTGGTASTTAPTPTTTTVGATPYYVSQKEIPTAVTLSTASGSVQSWTAIGNGTSFGQTFQLTSNTSVTNITLGYFFQGGVTSIKIYNGYGGALIATSTNTVTYNGGGYTYSPSYNFSNITLNANQTYYFELTSSSTTYLMNPVANIITGNAYNGNTSNTALDLFFTLTGTSISNPCESPRTAITVTINAVPTITGAQSMTVGGSTIQLTGSGTSDATTPWTSSNTAVATVSSTGVVTAVAGGNTTITYTNASGCSITAVIRVVDCAQPYGNALAFGQSTDFVQVNSSIFPNSNVTNFTIETWIKPSASDVVAGTPGGSWFGFLGSQNTLRNPSMWITNSGALHASWSENGSNSGTPVSASTPSTLVADRWTHVALVKDGTTMRIYANGIQVNSATCSASITVPNNFYWLGKVDNQFNGALDEVRFWSTARTQSQLQNTMYTELVGNETGLLAYFDFNEGIAGGTNTSISTLTNKANNASNGTLTNFTKTGTSSNFVGSALTSFTISGDAIICANSTSQYTHPMSGGTWSISNGANATINSSGLVTTLENEDVTISYTYSLNGCSITDSKAVSINTPAAPTATTTVNLCEGVPATALTATPSNGLILQWYTAATGGTASTTAPTPVTTSAGSTTYYVSQKANTGAFTIDNAAINNYANYVSNIGQTFTTDSNVKLTSITLKEAYFDYSNASTVLKVYNGVGGSLVATANSAYVNSYSGWFSGISFSFTNQNIILTAGQTYYFEIVSTSTMYPKYSNAYANGSGYINRSIISQDFAFKLESTIDASPCESSRTAITVNVNAVPTITGAQNMTVGGSTLQLTGSGTPDATTPWTSSNTAVATISSTGLVTAVGGGSTTLTYTVSNGCTKTAVISVVDCSQPLGNVLHFDGVDDYFATASNIAALNITANLTLETWIKFDQTHSDWVRLIGKGDANNRTYGLWLGTDNKLLFQINGTPTGLNFSSTTPLQPGNWYHIAAIRNGNTAKILINGVEDATATTSVSPQTNTFPLTVGYGTLHNYLKGSLEDVRVWNIARSDSQIQQGMYNSIAGNETGLVAYYDFNQGIAGGNNSTITTAIDKTTNALNGTLTNFGKTGATSNFIGNTIINFAISGATTVCANSTSQYTHSRSGGTWSISNGANATINATGLVTTLENENVTISYTYTINGCSVTDTKSVSINTPAAPVATSPVNLCKGITATALTATPTSGYELKWYTAATGGTASTTAPTPTTTTVGSTTYYVSQKAPSGPFIIDNTYNGNYANNISTFGQTFTSPNNIILNSITLKTAYINSNSPSIVLKVYNGYGGALIATANSPYTNSYGYTWFNDLAFSFSGQNIALTGGQTYYFEFVPNSTMYPGYSNAYANGTGYVNGGVISQDFAFKLDSSINSNPCESPRTAITVNVSEIPTISGVQNMTVGGSNIQLTGTGTPDATTPWTSSNTAVASISSTGVVTAQGGGTTTITYTNASGCSTTATIRVIDCAAPFGNALNFDGVNDYAVVDNVGNNSNLSFTGTANFTIEAWVKRESTNGIAMIFSKYNGGVAGNYWLGIDSTGKPILSREASPWGVTATNPMPVNEWHHIAATYDGSQTRIYVDGVLNNTTSAPSSINHNVSNIKVNIGAGLANNSPAYLFKGDIDEIRVWNVARTATQIQQSFITTLQGNESGLVAYYDFNQGTPAGNNTAITSIVNTVNSASNGTLTNFTKTGTTSNFIGNTTANISISGASNLCANATSQFTHIVSGGTWSVSSGAAATVSTSGLVTTLANEDITLSYTYSINGCSITVTKAISINSPAAPVATTTVNLCQGATSTALTATALTGHTLQWYTVATAGTASTTAPSPSTATTGTITFYVSQKNNTTACEGPRTAIAVTVNAATAITAQPSTTLQTYCINATPTDLSVTATGTGLSYQWYSNALASTTGATVITGATTAAYTPITTTASALYYYCVVTGTCGTVTSGFSGKITVNALSVGGTATATATTVCSNSTTTLTLTGHTGTIQWQQSADGTTGWANVTGGSGATTATYTTPPLTTATYYRALVTNSPCMGDYSTVASVSLNAATALTAQPSTTAQNVCINGITTTIAVTATGSGITYQWYRNTTATNTGGTLISGATNSVLMPSNTLVGTTYYYCVVSSTCSSPITSSVSGAISIAPASAAGTINGTASICSGATTTLTISGNVGTIQWQRLDSTVWTDLTGATSTTYTTQGLTQSTTYRAVVTSGVCSAATSANFNVVVNPLPVISGTTSVGAGESVTLTATTTAASSNAWVSSTPAVASVSNTGVINGLMTGTTTITYTNSNGCTDTEIITVVAGTTQPPILTLPATNTTGATTLNFNYTLPEMPRAGSVRLTFTPVGGGTPIVWTMNNATSATFSYVVGTNPTSISNVVSGAVLGFTTYNVTLSYQDAFSNPAASVTNTNIQTLAPPSISFASATYNGVINSAISIATINTGGSMVTYSIAPALPAGLSLNTTTGLISGTPTGTLAATTYTVTATNAAGTDTESFTLFIDADTDGDGIGNATDPDIDGDGISNGSDVDPDGDGINDNGTDTDGDGINDANDPDIDGDGILNGSDVDQNGDGINDNGTDVDGDGINDANDPDIDGDGISNGSDSDPDGDGIVTNGPDTDNDGINDANDPDIDGDGVLNGADSDPNGDGIVTNGPDTDGDGINDANDSDIDGDGISNGSDADANGDGSTDSGALDTDGDGIVDAADSDPDGDGIVTNGPDTDGDGINDANDNDIDGDGIPNGLDADPDGDGIVTNGPDTDGDGINDANDPDIDGDGTPNGADSDPDGDGNINNGPDTDGDGMNDANDSDIDGDGISNGADSDPDGDGIINNGPDTDGDGLNDAADSDPNGDGIIDNGPDTDGDGINDANDPDIDGDGILNGSDSDANGDGVVENGPDMDGDGISDANDSDMDGDGIPNGIDNCPNIVNPSVGTQPNSQAVNVCPNTTPPTLTVVAEGQQLTYQWFINTTNSNIGGTAIAGATSASYVPSNLVVGARYYYVMVSGTCGTAKSNVSGAITIQDIIRPIVVTQNSTVALNSSGQATVTAGQINNGSTDNCGIASITLNPSTFTCASIGPNTVTLTVTDSNGNVSSGTAVVTVTETTPPTVITRPVTVQLNASGAATITAAQVNNGSTDNCGIASISVNQTTFTCANIGPNTVTLTVTDVNGNVSTRTAIVTVQDAVLPTVITQNAVVNLDANGQATITAAQINNGSSDNCSIATITVSPSTFTCANLGANTVTLTITDASGNVATATATVTVSIDLATTGDNDFDGMPNNCDTDDDNDGILDTNDNCPLQANTDQGDNDNDGAGDACDNDDDNDGVLDEYDNCPLVYNPDQNDRDNDGLGDVCDTIEINVSQAISPNGDGVNDTWVIYNIENHPNHVVRLYNRWGNEVMYARNYRNDWDGHYVNKSNALPSNSYFYQIDLDGDGTVEHSGWIYITK
jgi:gliding motility-associated-like protein